MAPHLTRGEYILWVGRPTRYFSFGIGSFFLLIFGLSVTGFALYWTSLAYQGSGGAWKIGLLFVAAGSSMVLDALFRGMLIRRWSHYALTSERAFVLVDYPVFGAKLNHWPINKNTKLHSDHFNPMTIRFTHSPRLFSRGKLREVAFEKITNGEAVFKLMWELRDREKYPVNHTPLV